MAEPEVLAHVFNPGTEGVDLQEVKVSLIYLLSFICV